MILRALRRRLAQSVPFLRAASSSSVRVARNNKDIVLSLATLFILATLITALFVLRSMVITEAEEYAGAAGAEAQPPKVQPPSPPPPPRQRTVDTYAMDTSEFLAEVKSVARLRSGAEDAFEWHTSGPLEYATWQPRDGAPALMKVMVIGNMHARELFTADIVALWMYSGASPRGINGGTNNATLSRWVFVPVANPCGRDMAAQAYRAASTVASGGGGAPRNATLEWQVCHRGNCAGVDLNRNWITYRSSLYQRTGTLRIKRGRFWDGSPESNPGPEAFSEPETQALRALIHSELPDLVISVHSGGMGLFHPPEDGDTEEDLHSKFSRDRLADLERLTSWARRKTREISGARQRRLVDTTLPISGGSMVDYAVRHDVPLALTLEVYAGDNHASFLNESQDAAYAGWEHWGAHPLNCHRFYNPPQARLLEAANGWLRLWRALFYLSEPDKALFQALLGASPRDGPQGPQ